MEMDLSRIIILPGLDGTDLLLARFVKLAPVGHSATVVPLPDNPADDYDSLCDAVSPRFQDLDSCHVIAESFSGPLGVLLAHRYPDIIRRLTLVASFVATPVSPMARWIPWSVICRLPMPSIAARYLFVGSDHDMARKLKHAICQTSAATLVKRIHCLRNIDVSSHFAELRCGLRYVRAKQDRLVSARSLDKIVSINPTVVVREIVGPHLILQTRPRQAWSAILDGIQ